MEEKNVLRIKYAYGRGGCALDLSGLLPASAGDFNRLLSCVELSADPQPHAVQIAAHILERVADLQELRGHYNPEIESDKKQIAKINKEISGLCRNSAALGKRYDVETVSDGAAACKMKAGPVYVRRMRETPEADTVEEFDGWTFEKAGHLFDVYKDGKQYGILYHGTGLFVGHCSNRDRAPYEITPRVLESLNNGRGNIPAVMERHRAALIRAGFLEDDAATAADPAPVVVAADPAPVPAPAPVAAPVPAPAPAAADPAPVADPVPAADPAPVAAPAEDPAPRRKAPEKTFSGSVIQGRGWRILFDDQANRTRVIFDGEPLQAAKDATTAAGFWWSGNMRSFNKKLTFKAYRAAQALARELETIYAA